MASSSSRSVKVTDLNPHLLCVLCGGYYVDATTIIECLHSFCKSCIVRYLETNKYCPICDVQVHKTKPLLNIRADRKLQAIVYKLVPGLFQRELNSRKEFYKRHLESRTGGDAAAFEDSPVFLPNETLLLGVQYADSSSHQAPNKRYLRCPAAITISHLQKLMRAKFDLNATQRVEFLYDGDLLLDNVSLMDLAYMYHWKRKHPVELEYRLLECQQKKIKLSHEEEKPSVNPAEEKQDGVKVCENEVSKSVAEEPDREVQLQISENGVMSVQSVDSSANVSVNNTVDTTMPAKDIQLDTMELIKSFGTEVALNFDNSLAKTKVEDNFEDKEIPNNNNTIKNETVIEDPKALNCVKEIKDVKKIEKVSDIKNESRDCRTSTKESISVNNNDLEKRKSHTLNSSLSITVIPPTSSISSPGHAQKVYPGAVKDSNHLRHIRNKEASGDFKRPEVTIKPTTDRHDAPKPSTARYKTLKSPIKPWNPTIPRSAIMAMKQAQAANQEKDYPGKTTPKAPKFFKMRNIPRFLGNPASGVKPMYQVLPGSELSTQAPQTSVSQNSKPISTGELTVMKIDPKTLNPIPVSHSKSSKLNSSSSKPSTTFAPTHKPSERDLLGSGTPIRNPVSKSGMSSRAPSQVHSPTFPTNPFGLPSPHMLYPGFPRPFSQVDSAGSQLPPDSQILRAMSMLCSPGGAFHPSLPPSISMLFNPHHPHHRSTTDKLNFKYNPSDFHKAATTTTTPSVQRIPPSIPSAKISTSVSNSLNSSPTESYSSPHILKELDKHLAEEKEESKTQQNRRSTSTESYSSPTILKELDKHIAEEKREEQTVEESRRRESFTSTNDTKPKVTSFASSANPDSVQSRIGKISPLPITNGLSISPKGNLDRDLLKLHQNVSAKLSAKESTEQSSKDEKQRVDSKNVSESNN